MLVKDKVTEFFHAQLVREIRNEFRQSMTRYTEHITPEQQRQWFVNHRKTINDLYVFYNEFDCLVGYSYIRWDYYKFWGTLAVKKEFQGKGYGKYIYQDMMKTCKEIWIEIYAENTESLEAAVRAGFSHVDVSGNCVILKGVYNDPLI
jgi:GNAT superfamily N-acetyltransferase